MRRRKTTELLKMNQIKEILRLHFVLGLNQSEISRSVSISRSTVQNYICRAASKGITKTNLDDFSEESLVLLFKPDLSNRGKKAEPDYLYIQRELVKKEVTIALLWQEYIEANPEGHSYSGYCSYYHRWKASQKLSMRCSHKSGEKLYVDFAGLTVPVYDSSSGDVSFRAQVFVSVLGASNYIYAEAVPDQSLIHWIGAHVRAFSFYGGVTEIVVPDNLKSGVKKASFYDPEINPGYSDFARHYNLAVIPARVRKPKDKAKAEVGVQVVQRWILAVLRKNRFYSIAELNIAIRVLLEKVNAKKMKSYGVSRKELFDSSEKEFLKPLPLKEYQLYNTKLCRVNIDYHVQVEHHYYSVPFEFVGKVVEVRIREQTVEIIEAGKRIAIHALSKNKYQHTTERSHMPPSHQAMEKWHPTRLISWGEKIGPETKIQVENLLKSKVHPEQSYRACLGLLNLAKKVGGERLESACRRANYLNVASLRRVKSILDTEMDKLALFEGANSAEIEAILHSNIRGSKYYTH